MATNYETLKAHMEEYPRFHISFHGVESLMEGIAIVQQVTDSESVEVSSQTTAYSIGGELDAGGSITVFVTKQRRPGDGLV